MLSMQWIILIAGISALVVLLLLLWTNTYILQRAIIVLVCALSRAARPFDGKAICSAIDVRGKNISYESRFHNGIFDLYAKRANGPQPLILYLHGGYYIGGDKRGAAWYCRKLASLGFVVANVNYELAPQRRYPSQILQANEAVSFLLRNADRFGIDPSVVFIAGDSAGAHLASQMGLYYTNARFAEGIGGTPALRERQLRGLILLCGYYRMDTLRATNFPFLSASLWMMTGRKRFEETEIAAAMNTAGQLTQNYPAVFLTCGDQDPLVTQTDEMLRALREKGIEAAAYLPQSNQRSLWHEFQNNLNTPEGRTAMDETAKFLRQRAI